MLSNGRLEGTTPAAGGAQRTWHWVQDTPASTYLYSVVAGPFAVLHDEWRGIPVQYWTYPDSMMSAWRNFGETPAMLETYSQVLGVPFPWAKYDQSIIPDFTYGGMENVSATTQTDLRCWRPAVRRGRSAAWSRTSWPTSGLATLTTAATWAHIWLNEGLTTYMESVQAEKTRGWDAGEMEWLDQQNGAMGADLNEMRPLVWGIYPGTDPIVVFFSGHVYPKGAQLAHQLRRLLGDSLFWTGMRRFLIDNAHRPVTTADYASRWSAPATAISTGSSTSGRTGSAIRKVRIARAWNAASHTLDVTVEQIQAVDSLRPLFRFPVTLRVITRDSVVRQEITVSRQREVFHLALPSEPLSFRFDEGGWLLGTVVGDLTPGGAGADGEA